MEDKRKLRRTRVLKAGMISFGGSAISCTVRNLTKSGAMLDVVRPARRAQGIHAGDLVRQCPARMPDRLDQGTAYRRLLQTRT